MRTPEGDKIHAIIRARTGPEEAISAPAIARELRWTASRERLVRQIIASESLLWEGVVCATPGQGFFMPRDIDHLEKRRSVLVKNRDQGIRKLERFDEQCRKQGIYLEGAK